MAGEKRGGGEGGGERKGEVRERRTTIRTREVFDLSGYSGYLLFFQVCKTSASDRFSSLACVSRRSNRNLTTRGKLDPCL